MIRDALISVSMETNMSQTEYETWLRKLLTNVSVNPVVTKVSFIQHKQRPLYGYGHHGNLTIGTIVDKSKATGPVKELAPMPFYKKE